MCSRPLLVTAAARLRYVPSSESKLNRGTMPCWQQGYEREARLSEDHILMLWGSGPIRKVVLCLPALLQQGIM